jgi:GT2 family glycosyltransferase
VGRNAGRYDIIAVRAGSTIKRMQLTISVIIPVHNSGPALGECLRSLARSTALPAEIIVVDDGCTDYSLEFASGFEVRIVRAARRGGPAHSRNLGALAAKGDILLFVDADVMVHADTVERALAMFQSHPELDALFGSYDENPAAPGLVSQFRNLLHCFVHRTGRPRASTFWSGCGAVRREIFLQSDGFNISYGSPCIEDIEFGGRLIEKGGRIALVPKIQVTHTKRWTFRSMVRTDIWRRGVPWTRLALASGRMPNDLNVSYRYRCCAALSALAALLAGGDALERIGNSWAMPFRDHPMIAPALLLAVVLLNLDFYRFLAARRGAWFALRAIPLHLVFFLCCGVSFAIGLAQHFAARPRGVRLAAGLSKGE